MPPTASLRVLAVAFTFSAASALIDTGRAGSPILSVPSEYGTIQAAIDAAADGDVVEVDDGTYSGAGNVNLDFGGKDITVRSVHGRSATAIDADGTSRLFHLHGGETRLARIEGFLLRDGDAGGGPGGAILLEGASPTIVGCTIINAVGSHGGGVAATAGSFPLIQGTVVTSNAGTVRGGGLFVDETSAVEVESSTIASNVAGAGGGLAIAGGGPSSSTFTNVIFRFNGATSAGGGAELLPGGSSPFHRFIDCQFRENAAGTDGGGLAAVSNLFLSIEGGSFIGNESGLRGGGLFVEGADAGPSVSGTVIVTNLSGADGGGVYTDGLCDLDSCTIADNRATGSGGGVCAGPSALVPGADRTIVWSNCADGAGDAVYAAAGSSLDFDCSNVDLTGIEGPGSVTFDAASTSVDPLFCQPACCDLAPLYSVDGLFRADYALDPTSPLRAAASTCGALVGAVDEGCPEPFDASGVTLLGHVPTRDFACGVHLNDVWGYVSPSGREYALVGLGHGTGFVDVTVPASPVVLAVFDDQTTLWSDQAVYDEYAYNVNQWRFGGGDGIQVFDLTDIDSGVVTKVGDFVLDGIDDAHNITVNAASGFAYLSLPNTESGLPVVDLSTPSAPVLTATYDTGEARVHDCYVVTYPSDHAAYADREIAFLAQEGFGLAIVDVTSKAAMFELASLIYPGTTYAHQGWLSTDLNTFYLGDELDEEEFGSTTTTYVFDVSDLTNPTLVTTFTNGLTSIDHNLMVAGSLIFEANYTSGLRVFDASDPMAVGEIGYFDTHPESDAPVYAGAWGIFSHLPSGNVLVSDIQRGLYVFSVDMIDAPSTTSVPSSVRLAQNHPNPFNPRTTYAFDLPAPGSARLVVFDASGRLVRTLVDDVLAAGRHEIVWDGLDDGGTGLPSGVYLTRLETDSRRLEQKSILLK